MGDELIAAGQARRLSAQTGRKVRLLDRNGRQRWHELWTGNPAIAQPGDTGDAVVLTNGPGARPYIDYRRSTRYRWAWRAFECEPAELAWVKPNDCAHGLILVEPALKNGASPNKQWHGWRAFAAMAIDAGLAMAQMCPPGRDALPGVQRIETATFMDACSVLAGARAIVAHEGGLHHAAAALGKRAVVIFGGFISPAQTGYAGHTNLFTGGEPCGWRRPCAHCQAAMRQITPEMVLQELQRLLVSQETGIAA